jgi:hypothetical protein
MPLDDVVKVSIVASGSTPTAENFSTPLILAYHNKNTDRVRSYADEAGMVADGYTIDDPAMIRARAVFSQNPRVGRVKIGRRALAWTQVIELTPAAPSAGMVYGLDVNLARAEYTAGGGDNLAAVCTALAAAINTAAGGADPDAIIATGTSTAGPQTISGTGLNGVVGGKTMAPPRAVQLVLNAHANWLATTAVVTGVKDNGQIGTENLAIPAGGNTTVNGTVLWRSITSLAIPTQGGTNGTYTLGTRAVLAAVGSSGTKVVVTAAFAGWLQKFGRLTSTLSLFDATTDPGIATDLAAVFAADSDWYGLLLDSNSSAEILAAGQWTESNKRLFAFQSADTACKDPASTTDILSRMQALTLFRSVPAYHSKLGSLEGSMAAAWVGERFPDTPGTDTWVQRPLAGIEVDELSQTELLAILAKNGNAYVKIQGLNRTYGGASGGGKTSGGEWIDIVRGIDALRSDMQVGTYGVLANARGKVPYSEKGIAVVKGAVRDSLDRFTSTDDQPRLLTPNPPPTVTAPAIKDISPTDKGNRKLPGVRWRAYVEDAIHAVEIEGEVLS